MLSLSRCPFGRWCFISPSDETTHLLRVAIGLGLVVGALSFVHFEKTAIGSFFVMLTTIQMTVFAGGVFFFWNEERDP